MIETPIILPDIQPFNANVEYELKFYINTNSQVTSNELIIEDNIGREVYNKISNSYVYSHEIPAYTLENGKDYKAKVRVKISGKGWSEFSALELFSCLTPPNIRITNIDYDNGNQIYNQNFTFEATYDQREGDKPSLYRFKLYDKGKVLLRSYNEKVFGGVLFEHVDDLANNVEYYIEVMVTSQKGAIDSSGLIIFRPVYDKTSLTAIIDLSNNTKEGTIELKTRLVQIKGKLYDDKGKLIHEDSIEYIEDEYLDLNRNDYDRLVFDEGLLMNDDSFTTKIWMLNISERTPKGDYLFSMKGEFGNSSLYFYNNRFHIFKKLNKSNKISHYVSNKVKNSMGYMVQFSSNMGHMSLIAKEVDYAFRI